MYMNMNKQPVLLALSGIILVSAVIIGVIYDRGLGPDDVPIDGSGPTPAPLHQPNITVSATYNDRAETVRIQIESGRMTAEEYDMLRITSHSGGDVGDARLKRPGQSEIHPSGKWVDTESGGLTSFPVKSGDSIIVVTVDQTDNDGDGIDGIDGENSLELNYGHRQGVQRQGTLATWTLDNGTLIRSGS